MTKRKAVKVDHLSDMPLDLTDVLLRIERRHWDDGTSCLHIAKWGVQPNTGRPAPWWPTQITQVPWEFALPLSLQISRAAYSVDDPASEFGRAEALIGSAIGAAGDLDRLDVKKLLWKALEVLRSGR